MLKTKGGRRFAGGPFFIREGINRRSCQASDPSLPLSPYGRRPAIAFERNIMRKIIIASMAAAAFSLAACSEKTQDAASETATSAADDAAAAGDVAADAAAGAADATAAAADEAADATAAAADKAGNAVEGTVNAAGEAADKAGDKIAEETKKAEANDKK